MSGGGLTGKSAIREAHYVRLKRIREATIGSWDGLTHADIDARWPGLLDGSSPFDWYFRAPNGEGYDEAVNRVAEWLSEVQGIVVAISTWPDRPPDPRDLSWPPPARGPCRCRKTSFGCSQTAG
jgi:hypothetical protein